MIKHLKTFEWSTDFECTSCSEAFNVQDDSDAVMKPNKGHVCQTRPGLGTALEFTTLGDPPVRRDPVAEAKREAQLDHDWADFARGVMDG